MNNLLPKNLVSLKEYERMALQKLDSNALAYIHSGASDEISFHANHKAFDSLFLQGAPLESMEGANMELELFGEKFSHPLFLAPVAHQKLAHSQGELATAQAANAMNTCMIVSSFSNYLLEDIADALLAPKWFQLYAQRDFQDTLHLIQRAQNAGYSALVITIDAPIAGIRHTEQKMAFSLPEGVSCVNTEMYNNAQSSLNVELPILQGVMQNALTWEKIQHIKEFTSLPLILKGINSVAYAKKAMELGVDAIVVSNHGGRTLDTLTPSILALPAIANAVNKKIPILLDGGVRRGSDVVKAIALGASGVLIGRPIFYGLSVAGALGVAHSLKLLKEEFEIAMALTGCKNLAEIDERVLF